MSGDTTQASVQALEQRAAAAEQDIAALKSQLLASGEADLQARLHELLKLMYEDRDECEAIRAQRDELREENERLRGLVAKHEYRIKHLLRTIDLLDPSDAAKTGSNGDAAGH